MKLVKLVKQLCILAIIFLSLTILIKILNQMREADNENFVPLGVKYIRRRNAKLNNYGGVDYVDEMPPCYRGEYGCRTVPCPAVFEKDIICWKCDEIIANPQNE